MTNEIYVPKERREQIESFYMSPVKHVGGGDIERCKRKEADFYSVYCKYKDGTDYCVGDFSDMKLAEEFSKFSNWLIK